MLLRKVRQQQLLLCFVEAIPDTLERVDVAVRRRLYPVELDRLHIRNDTLLQEHVEKFMAKGHPKPLARGMKHARGVVVEGKAVHVCINLDLALSCSAHLQMRNSDHLEVGVIEYRDELSEEPIDQPVSRTKFRLLGHRTPPSGK